jgi:hypothetical protein
MASSKDREPLRPRVMVPGTWAHRVSGAMPVQWFLRASAAFFVLGFVVASVHHWWWLVVMGLLGGSSSLLQLRELRRKAAKNQRLSD